MKKLIILFLVAFSVLFSVNVFATSTEYECLEIGSNCIPTGNTIVYELEWISQDTLQVTVSTTASQSGDHVTFYNLTSNAGTVSGNTRTISNLSSNTKFIPFDDTVALTVWECEGHCQCECSATYADTGCELHTHMAGEYCTVTDITMCTSCYYYCEGTSNGVHVYGGYGGILVEANVVVFVTD